MKFIELIYILDHYFNYLHNPILDDEVKLDIKAGIDTSATKDEM